MSDWEKTNWDEESGQKEPVMVKSTSDTVADDGRMDAGEPAEEEDRGDMEKPPEEKDEVEMPGGENDLQQDDVTAQQDYDWDTTYKEPVRQYKPLDPPQKNNNKAMVIVMVLLFALLAGLCIYVLVTLSKGIDRLHVKKDVEYESSSDDPWAEILGEEDKDAEKEQDEPQSSQDAQEEEDSASSGYFDKKDFDDQSWKEAYQNHDASEFSEPYYEDFVDCIDETVSYRITREFEEYADESYNICIRASYVQIEGDIPNVDEINRQLKSEALSDLEWFKEKKTDYEELAKKYEAGVRSDTKSFVTFNDDETLSVAVEYTSNFCYDTSMGIRGINVNLKMGTIMDNTQILQLEDSFGEEFRQRSNKQNGSTYGIELFSNVEIVSMLKEKDSIIIFYTPIGLELGYSYEKDGYTGWVTISMQDYENYMKTL